MPQPHDPGYRRLFAHPEMIRDLLTGFVDAAWVADLDFARLERFPGEFVDDRLRTRRNDLIWRLPCGEGGNPPKTSGIHSVN